MEERSFVQWMRNTNQVFVGDEYQLRFGLYQTAARYVQEHNRKGYSWTVAMNKFACLTPAEYKVMLGYRESPHYTKIEEKKNAVKDVPDSIDWRDSGVVNPIKDQAQCGSCWAFSAIQAMESAWAIKHSKLLSLSEQNLVDCCCYGCDGGVPSDAYNYVINHQSGIFETEDGYPYTATTGTCHFDQSVAAEAKITSHKSPSLLPNETKLKEAIAEYGPASVCIDASQASFQLYSGGIYDESSCHSLILDHAVGCVGYGTSSGTDYWLIRNSWGTSWGEAGYIRIRRNHNNRCGVATKVVFPEVA
jgi:cathepsin L